MAHEQNLFSPLKAWLIKSNFFNFHSPRQGGWKSLKMSVIKYLLDAIPKMFCLLLFF